MANIQVPRLNRLEPQGEATTGRVQTQLPNLEQVAAPMNQAISRAGEVGLKLYEKFEDDKADTEALRLVNQYQQIANEKLTGKNGVRWQEGDPTAVYDKFDSDMDGVYNEILSQVEGSSDKVKGKVKAKLDEAYFNMYDKRTGLYGHQYNVYQTKVTNDAVKLAQEDLLDASSGLNAKDPKSFTKFNSVVNKIATLREDQAVKLGAAERDETGKISFMTDSVKFQMAKDLSEGITLAVDNLNAAGKPDLAQELLNKYSDQIDAHSKSKLTKAVGEAKIEQDAYNLLDEALLKKPSERNDFLNNVKVDDKIRDKAFALLDSRTRQQEQIKSRAENTNFDILFRRIDEKQRSATPYADVEELESDSFFKLRKNKISPEQLSKIYKMVENPKESDEDVKFDLYQAFADGRFLNLSADQLRQSMIGLNEKDKGTMEYLWRTVNSETTVQEARRADEMMKGVTKKALQMGLVKEIRGRLSASSKNYLNQLRDQVLSDFEKYPKMSVQEQNRVITDILIAEQEKANARPKGFFESVTSFFGGGKKATPTTTTVAPTTTTLPIIRNPKTGPKAKAPSKTVPTTTTIPVSEAEGYASLSQVPSSEKTIYYQSYVKSKGTKPNLVELLGYINEQKRAKK